MLILIAVCSNPRTAIKIKIKIKKENHMENDIYLPLYAHFQHPDGSWYRLWISHSEPKTERGHPWHVHASYDKTGTLAPIAGTRWWEEPYGTANWSFDTREEALAEYQRRAAERLSHGYELREGMIPESGAETGRAA